jgi:hypothetical protein
VTTYDPALAGQRDAPYGGAWRSPRVIRGVATRLGAAAGAALLLGALRIHRPPALATVCALRATTGIPCPLCGGTTVFVRLGRGRVVDAVAANPVVVLVAIGLVLAPTGVFAPLRHHGRLRTALVFALLGGSWLWQLGRFGYLT